MNLFAVKLHNEGIFHLAKLGNLRHTVHSVEGLGHKFRILLELLQGIRVVSSHRQKNAVNGAVIVNHYGVNGAHRQLYLGVRNLLAHIIPILIQLTGRNRFFQLNLDLRIALLGNTLRVVNIGDFLQRLLNHIRDIKLHAVGIRFRIERDHQGFLDFELRILQLAQLNIGKNAPDNQ